MTSGERGVLTLRGNFRYNDAKKWPGMNLVRNEKIEPVMTNFKEVSTMAVQNLISAVLPPETKADVSQKAAFIPFAPGGRYPGAVQGWKRLCSVPGQSL